MFAVLAALAAPAFGQDDAPAFDEPPWRDLAEATRQLDSLHAAIADAEAAIADAEAELADIADRSQSVDDQTVDIAIELQATQDRARRLAVEAYITGGPLADSLYVLDAETANDYAYRATLLTESAGAVAEAQDHFHELREVASDAAVDLAHRIDDLRAGIEASERTIAEAEAAIPDAEWVVAIAEIHAAADEQMERWGRIEPTPEDWDKLRFCESSRNYQINTGNSYYGAYQFNVVTWVDMGGSGLPSDAPPEEQDARARYLYALRGSGYNRGGAWPVCGRFLPSG